MLHFCSIVQINSTISSALGHDLRLSDQIRNSILWKLLSRLLFKNERKQENSLLLHYNSYWVWETFRELENNICQDNIAEIFFSIFILLSQWPERIHRILWINFLSAFPFFRRHMFKVGCKNRVLSYLRFSVAAVHEEISHLTLQCKSNY